MQIKMNILGAAVALAVSGAAQAGTAPILFDTNGAAAGGVINVSTFDWSPDNTLAVDAVPLAAYPATNTFNAYSQAQLGNFLDGANQTINGTGLNTDFEITFQAGITEIGTSGTIPGLNAWANFDLAPLAGQTVNFFTMYYDTNAGTFANQLAGTGYGDGTAILQAVVVGNNTTFSVPFIDLNGDGIKDGPEIGLLDNFGVDNQNGTMTVYGNGGGTLQADVTFANGAYFLSNIVSLLIDLEFNTSNITPFSQANPSDLVVGMAPTYGNLGGVPTNGFSNCGTAGPTCDFQFQSDANNSFYVTVPEPGSLLLLGAGLMGMGWAARRRKS